MKILNQVQLSLEIYDFEAQVMLSVCSNFQGSSFGYIQYQCESLFSGYTTLCRDPFCLGPFLALPILLLIHF